MIIVPSEDMEIGWEGGERREGNADYSEESCRNAKILSAIAVNLLNEKWTHTKHIYN